MVGVSSPVAKINMWFRCGLYDHLCGFYGGLSLVLWFKSGFMVVLWFKLGVYGG